MGVVGLQVFLTRVDGKCVSPSYYSSPPLLLSSPSTLDCRRHQHAGKKSASCRRRRLGKLRPLLLAKIAHSSMLRQLPHPCYTLVFPRRAPLGASSACRLATQ